MSQAKVEESTITVSQKQESLIKMLLPLDDNQGKKTGKLSLQWLRDENSKLYCQWFVEQVKSTNSGIFRIIGNR